MLLACFFYLDTWDSIAFWDHLVLHTHPRMSINPSKMRLHLIFTIRIWVIWDRDENGIPSCKCRGSEPSHNLVLCLPGLKLCAKSLKHIWEIIYILIFSSPHWGWPMRTARPSTSVQRGPPESPRQGSCPQSWSWSLGDFSPDPQGWDYSSSFQAHLTPAMNQSWKHILGAIAPHGAWFFGSVSEWVCAWFLILLQHLSLGFKNIS